MRRRTRVKGSAEGRKGEESINCSILSICMRSRNEDECLRSHSHYPIISIPPHATIKRNRYTRRGQDMQEQAAFHQIKPYTAQLFKTCMHKGVYNQSLSSLSQPHSLHRSRTATLVKRKTKEKRLTPCKRSIDPRSPIMQTKEKRCMPVP